MDIKSNYMFKAFLLSSWISHTLQETRLSVCLSCDSEKARLPSSNAACTWPGQFASTHWHDSFHGDITFGSSNITGWSVKPTSGVNISEWECLSVDTFNSDGRMLFKSPQTFDIFDDTFYTYLCITLTKVTDYSYQYYINSVVKNERISISSNSSLRDADTICSDREGASGPEYQMLIKTGNESAATTVCPWMFLGSYGYTHTTAAGTVTCDSSTSQWDMCTDSTQMTFNYSTCPTKVAYSKSNTVWCVNNVVVNDTNYVMIYNGNDADADIDGSTIYRFACFAITSSGDRASVSPEHCQHDQSPDKFPVNLANERIGAILEMSSPSESCHSCSELSDFKRGTVTISTSGAVTSAVYTCDTNHTLEGSPNRTCLSDDTWSGTEPVCTCIPPPRLDKGNVTVSNGSVATYTCNAGYTLDGYVTRTCQIATATWEEFGTVCVKCDNLTNEPGQSYNLSTDGMYTTAVFTCAEEYSLNGDALHTCTSSGNWTADQPSCVKCEVFNEIQNGSFLFSSNGTVTKAMFTCSNGHTLRGETTLTCNRTGMWDGSPPTCVKCSTLDNAPGTSHSLLSDGATTTAHYSCALGYTLRGPKLIKCTNGVWDNDQPTCVFCSNITDPTNGNVTLSTNGTITSADYACADKYHVIGHKQRHCSSNGTWMTAPVCKCSNKTFGDKCVKSCGFCINGETCDSENGACPNGCTHPYIGAQCQDTASKMSSELSGTHVGILIAGVLVVIAAVCFVGCIYVRKRKETPFKRTDDELTSSAIVNESYGIEEAPFENAYDNVNESPAHDEKTDTSEDL